MFYWDMLKETSFDSVIQISVKKSAPYMQVRLILGNFSFQNYVESTAEKNNTWIHSVFFLAKTGHLLNITIFTWIQDEGFSLNLVLKYVRSPYMDEALNGAPPNRITLNQTLQSQTKAYITKSSHIDKCENTTWMMLTDTILFFLTLSSFF